mmetsp:Transcript_2655/g.1869  ORF Transcript_2655/g.1869 Transcript_2655/m.1869 type:complete len:156 (+) Transcript_2655:717-1184(+)
MKAVEEELMFQLSQMTQVWLPARAACEAAWQEKEKFHPSGEFIYLGNYCPFVSHLLDIEQENDCSGKLQYAIYLDEHGNHRVHSMPGKASFSSRAPLSKAWRGLRNEELAKISGIDDIIFVHHAGFIGGAKSLQSAVKMGEISLAEIKKEEQPSE